MKGRGMLSVKPIGQETRRRQRETTKRPSEKNKERKRERGFSIDCVDMVDAKYIRRSDVT